MKVYFFVVDENEGSQMCFINYKQNKYFASLLTLSIFSCKVIKNLSTDILFSLILL